jgi:hypothetical protein
MFEVGKRFSDVFVSEKAARRCAGFAGSFTGECDKCVAQSFNNVGRRSAICATFEIGSSPRPSWSGGVAARSGRKSRSLLISCRRGGGSNRFLSNHPETPPKLPLACEGSCPNWPRTPSGCAFKSDENPECRFAPLRANLLAALSGCGFPTPEAWMEISQGYASVKLAYPWFVLTKRPHPGRGARLVVHASLER